MNSSVIVVLAVIAAAQANVVYRKLKLEDRIINGQIAVPHSLPYQAYMMMRDAAGDIYQCGGSLLTTTRVLTAAHCVKDYESIIVYLGAYNVNELEPTQQRRDGIESAYHTGFNAQTHDNDIAIVTLESPVELNQYVQLTTLPTRADVGNTYVGALATVSGWGVYSDNIEESSDILRYVSSYIVSNAVCNEDHGNIIPSKICMDGSMYQSACYGDSGGPLVTGTNRVQIGIASYGSTVGCGEGYDGVFTRITEYFNWIEIYGGIQIS